MMIYVFAVMVVLGAWLLFRLWKSSSSNQKRNTRRAVRASAPARRTQAGKAEKKYARGRQAPAKRRHPPQPTSKPQAPHEKTVADAWPSHRPPMARPTSRATESPILMTRVRPPATSTAGIVRAPSSTHPGDTGRTAPAPTAAPSPVRAERASIEPMAASVDSVPTTLPTAASIEPAPISPEAVTYPERMPITVPTPVLVGSVPALSEAATRAEPAPTELDPPAPIELATVKPPVQKPTTTEMDRPLAPPAPTRVIQPVPPVGALPTTLRTASNDVRQNWGQSRLFNKRYSASGFLPPFSSSLLRAAVTPHVASFPDSRAT
jgi:hypothetical protein